MPPAVRKSVFRPDHAQRWTRERIELLGRKEIEQLRENARELGEAAIVERCDEVLAARRKRPAKAAAAAAAAPGATGSP